MNPYTRTVSALGIAVVIAACSSPPPPAPKPIAAPVPPMPAAAATPAAPPPAAPAPATTGAAPATAAASPAPQPVKPGQPVGSAEPARPGQPPVVAATTPAAQPGSTQAADAIRAAGETMEPPKPLYDVRGRRDPFQNLELAAKEGESTGRFSVAATKLTGIIQGPTSPLALVETTEGHGYILKPGDTLGEGRVLEIGRDSVVFIVPPRPGSSNNKLVLKLTTD